MNLKNAKVVVYTSAGARVVTPLIDAGINVVGIAEESNYLENVSQFKKCVLYLYWVLIKLKSPRYLSRISRIHNIEYIATKNPNDLVFRAWLKKLSPDILLAYRVSVLNIKTFSIPKYGSVNLHPSLLPKYRGSYPIFWMHINYDLNGGVTLHHIDKGIDTGKIIAQTTFSIKPGMSENEVEYLAIEKCGIPLFINYINNNHISEISSDTERNHYARRVSSREYFELLDWDDWSLVHMWHVLRVSDHWKVAFTTNKLDNLFKLTIGKYEFKTTSQQPGQFIRNGKKMFITHKDGIILVNRELSFKKIILLIIRV